MPQMLDADRLPSAPTPEVRESMVGLFKMSKEYKDNPCCRVVVFAIRSGYMSFYLPNVVQLTKEGQRHMNHRMMN